MAKIAPKTKSVTAPPTNTGHTIFPARPPQLLSEVFILESLKLSDEQQHRFEGQALASMLRMSGKNPKYHYFQDEAELPILIKLFKLSKYKYLHLSCHGETNKIFTTYGEISDYQLARYLEGSLVLKRLFFSACKVGNENFSEIIAAKNKGMHSIVAPIKKIRFDHAAAIWNALYLSLFTENSDRMTHERILKRLRSLSQLFPIDFHLSAYHPDNRENPWEHQTIGKKGIHVRPVVVNPPVVRPMLAANKN